MGVSKKGLQTMNNCPLVNLSSFSDVTTGMRVYSFLFYILFKKVNWCLAQRIGPNLFSPNESINKVFKCFPNR